MESYAVKMKKLNKVLHSTMHGQGEASTEAAGLHL